jgi:hypothetical protein
MTERPPSRSREEVEEKGEDEKGEEEKGASVGGDRREDEAERPLPVVADSDLPRRRQPRAIFLVLLQQRATVHCCHAACPSFNWAIISARMWNQNCYHHHHHHRVGRARTIGNGSRNDERVGQVRQRVILVEVGNAPLVGIQPLPIELLLYPVEGPSAHLRSQRVFFLTVERI